MPHEELMQEIQNVGTYTFKLRLQEAIQDGNFPPAYDQHPVVQGSSPDDPVLPVALYLDGLPYTLTDSVLGIWLINMLTGVHHCLIVLRKRLCCKCGCRGWCTLYKIWTYLHWSLKAMADKVYPDRRPDASEFTEGDQLLRSHAGQQMLAEFAACICKVIGLDFVVSLGSPIGRVT